MSEPYETVGAIRRACYAIADHYDMALIPAKLTSGVKLPTQASDDAKMKYAAKVFAHSPAPTSVDVLDARRGAYNDLLHYTRIIQFEVTNINGGLIQTRVDAGNVRELCAFIERWAEKLAEQCPAEAMQAADDLPKHGQALKGYALPSKRDWMPLGDCPITVADADGNSVECGHRVRAYNREQDSLVWSSDADASARTVERIQFIRCPGCGHEDTLAWWMSQIVGNPEAKPLVTADELISVVARDLGHILTHATIRQWVHRNQIPKAGKDAKGRNLYDHAIVVALIREGRAA